MSCAALDPAIEPMREDDLAAVSAVEAALQAFPWTQGNFADSLNSGYSAWVLRLNAQVRGFSVVMQVLDEAHLLNIGLDASLHGQGLGGRLLRQALDCARLNGATKMFLEVRPSNERAVALYRHFGFAQIGLRKGYYPAVNGREDALIFARDIA